MNVTSGVPAGGAMPERVRRRVAQERSRPVVQAGAALLADLRHGLSAPQKELSPKYFYDTRGSQLFEAITRLDEYYLTRAERGLLSRRAAPWLAASGARALVELGAGDADKTRVLLSALPAGSTYVPVDISAEFLAGSAAATRAEYPHLDVQPVAADITHLAPGVRPPVDTAVFAFLGSTLGNFPEPAAIALLTQVRRCMRAGDALLLGADLVKDAATLERAYNDAAGITAAFNLNLLRVLNRRAGTDFDRGQFRHVAFFDAAFSRIEMHLLSLAPQRVRVPGWREVRLARGESIRTEVSCKYTRASLARLLAAAGMALAEWWSDGQYGLLVAQPLAAGRQQARSDGAFSAARCGARTPLPDSRS